MRNSKNAALNRILSSPSFKTNSENSTTSLLQIAYEPKLNIYHNLQKITLLLRRNSWNLEVVMLDKEVTEERVVEMAEAELEEELAVVTVENDVLKG